MPIVVDQEPRRAKRTRGWLITLAFVTGLVIGIPIISGWIWLEQRRNNGELQRAAMQGDVEGMESLIKRGARFNYEEPTPPLLLAASCYHPEAVRCLLRHGADPNIRNSGDWNTPLLSVVFGAQLRPVAAEATARALLEYGADVRAKNRRGESPLAWAQRVGKTLERNPQFFADTNASYPRADLPPDAEVGRIRIPEMERRRRELVAAILKAGNAAP